MGLGYLRILMSTELVPAVFIERSIRLVRGQKVLLDADLAHLYGVSAKRLNDCFGRLRRHAPSQRRAVPGRLRGYSGVDDSGSKAWEADRFSGCATARRLRFKIGFQ